MKHRPWEKHALPHKPKKSRWADSCSSTPLNRQERAQLAKLDKATRGDVSIWDERNQELVIRFSLNLANALRAPEIK